MTMEQEQHLGNIKLEFIKLVDAKYRRGAEEHGGDLKNKSVLDLLKEAREELLDQWVYLQTAINALQK